MVEGPLYNLRHEFLPTELLDRFLPKLVHIIFIIILSYFELKSLTLLKYFAHLSDFIERLKSIFNNSRFLEVKVRSTQSI